MKELQLTNSDKHCLVDDDIWLRFCRYSWRVKMSGHTEYIVRSHHVYLWNDGTRRRKTITLRLHRLVMECPESKEVHHKNGDPYDNRRENLEVVDKQDHRRESANRRWSQ